jgi:PhzF family phenazine biosynthesis protein
MKRIRIRQVDAFTNRIFGGNPAGVVSSAYGLSDEEMQSIAKEMNLSETAFVLPSDKADFRIRWFTPKKEVLFCGHATVASLHVLAEEGRFGMEKDGIFNFKIESMVGILNVDVMKGPSTNIVLQSPPIELVSETFKSSELVQALKIGEAEIEDRLPIMRDRTVNYVYIPVRRLATLRNLNYDYDLLEKFGDKHGIEGFTVFTTETFEKNSNVHSRFFSPFYGVREDPTTGSSHGPLGAYLVLNGLAKLDEGKVEIRAEQGDIMGRPGRMTVKVTRKEDGRLQAQLIAQAVTVIEGEMNLP